MVVRGSACRLLSAELEWELFLVIQVCVKRVVQLCLSSVTVPGPKRMAGAVSGRCRLDKSSFPQRVVWYKTGCLGHGHGPKAARAPEQRSQGLGGILGCPVQGQELDLIFMSPFQLRIFYNSTMISKRGVDMMMFSPLN